MSAKTTRIAKLNPRYADLPGDFADLTLVTLSERLVSRMPASEAEITKASSL